MTYPAVIGEAATLVRVLAGRSLARFGDGELNLCTGGPCVSQRPDARLAARLRAILEDSGECLVGIPNIDTPTPKAAFWAKYANHDALTIDRGYVSAFVTRPDSAPWIDTSDYWAAVESLWQGQDVTLVRGSGRSLTVEDLTGARVTEVMAPWRDAWTGYDALLERIGTPARAILCLGPTATVLAVDLCAKGVHAIDLGHIGMFLKKHRRGEPMTVTPADKFS